MKIFNLIVALLLGIGIALGYTEMTQAEHDTEEYEFEELPEEIRMELEFYRHNHDRFVEGMKCLGESEE